MAAATLRQVPRPLALLLLVILVATTVWTFFDSPWQVMDETRHFGYVESLAVQHEPPSRDSSYGGVSDRSQRAIDDANGNRVAFDNYARPPWSENAGRRYEAHAHGGDPDNGGHITSVSFNPPLYYLVELIPYAAASGGTTLDRLFAMRWFSGLWALVIAIGGWLLAGEVLGRDRLAQLVTAATLGLWPMITYLSAGVSAEGMVIALCTLVLWLSVRIVRRGVSKGRVLALVAVLAAAVATKVSALALAPGALLAVASALPAVRTRVGDRLPRLLGLAAILFVVPAVVLFGAAKLGVAGNQLGELSGQSFDVQRLGAYLWQFYLPRLSVMEPQVHMVSVISTLPLYNVWLGTSWGTFGWASIWFPAGVYKLFLAVSIAVLGGALVRLTGAWRRERCSLDRRLVAIALVLAVGALGTLAGVHLQDFSNLVHDEVPFAQGRYLFPVAGIGALAVGAALRALPVRARPLAAGAWLGGLIAFQVAALALVASQFYV